MDTLRTAVLAMNIKLQALEESQSKAEHLANEIRQQHQRIRDWADMYGSASP